MSWIWQPLPTIVSPIPPATCGFRSLFAFWLGGASMSSGITFTPFFYTPQQTVYRM